MSRPEDRSRTVAKIMMQGPGLPANAIHPDYTWDLVLKLTDSRASELYHLLNQWHTEKEVTSDFFRPPKKEKK